MAKFGLKHELRPYKCTNCGHKQKIATNHTDSCSAICKGCSWKRPAAGHYIPALGNHTYLRFEYIRKEGL